MNFYFLLSILSLVFCNSLFSVSTTIYTESNNERIGTLEPIFIQFNVPFIMDSVYTETASINEKSNILVYNSIFNDSSSSVRRNHSMSGKLQIFAPNILKFTPNYEFDINHDLTVEVNKLYFSGLVGFPPAPYNSISSNVLTTYDYLPVIVSSNIYNDLVPCNDTIRVCFLGKYDNIYNLTNLVKIYKVDSTFVSNQLDTISFQYIDTTLLTVSDKEFSEFPTVTDKHEIPINVTYDSITNCLIISPYTSYVANSLYYLRIDIGEIVLGEPSSNFRQTFYKKAESRVKIKSITQDTSNDISNSVLSNMGSKIWSLPIGDTLAISVPSKIDNLQFWRWKSNDFPEINNSNLNPYPIMVPCGTEINIYAEYIDPCLDTISFVFDSSKIKITTLGYNEQLDYNSFTFKKYFGNDFTFIASPKDSTVSIDSIFIDNNLEIIGFDSPIKFENNQNFIDPCDRELGDNGEKKEVVIGSKDNTFLSTCNEMKFCIQIHKDDSKSEFQFTQVLSGIVDYSFSSYDYLDIQNDVITACKTFSSVGPTESRTWTFNVNIVPSSLDKYEITYAYSVYNKFESGTVYNEDAIGNSLIKAFTIQNPTDICQMELHVFIKPKTKKLYVEHYVKDGLLPAYTTKFLDIIKLDEDDDDHGRLVQDESEICRDENGVQLIRYVYEYPYDTEAKHYPLIYDLDGLYQYNEWVSIEPINDDYCESNLTTPIYSTHSNYPFEDFLSVNMSQDWRIIYEFSKAEFYLEEIHLMLPSPAFEEDDHNGGTGFRRYNVPGSSNERLDEFTSDLLVGMKEPVRPYFSGLTCQNWYTQQNLPTPHRLFFWDGVPFINPPPFLSEDNWKNSFYTTNQGRVAPITPIEYSLNFHRNTTKVKFLFSHPVDINSLQGNLSFSDIVDPKALFIWGHSYVRLDGFTPQHYKFKTGSYSNGGLLEDDKLVEMSLVSKPFTLHASTEKYYRFSPIHTSYLVLNVLSNIKRASDMASLSNPLSNYRIRTENPKLYAYLMDVYHKEDGDDCGFLGGDPDIYAHIFSDILRGDFTTKAFDWEGDGSSAFKYGTYSLEKNTVKIPESRTLLLQTQNPLQYNDLAVLGFHIADEGYNDNASSKAGDAGANAGVNLLNKALEPAIKDIDNLYFAGLAAAGGGIIGAGLHLAISELMKHGLGCDDFSLAKATLLGKRMNLWHFDPAKTGLLYGRDYEGIINGGIYNGGYSKYELEKAGIRLFWILGDF